MNVYKSAIGHLIRCREVTRLVSQLQDRPPTGWEGFRLRAHLAVCIYCHRFDEQVRFLRLAMRRLRD